MVLMEMGMVSWSMKDSWEEVDVSDEQETREGSVAW
tara:strand:+ start:798 stop:905 length:108 start_codon:yes stop_codon:yes gene_type:complete